MFKKALILSLAVCLLSVNVFAGTAMMSMAADYSAVQGPVKEETVTIKPEAVRVLENESTGTQTITYYSADNLSTSQIKTNVTGTTDKTDTNKTWFYLKIPRNGLTSVTAASITAQLRYNNGYTTFYIRELADTVWESATSGLTENNKTLTTANNDTLLSVPDAGAELYSLQKSSATNIAEYSMESEELTEYINSDADGNVYFAVYAVNSKAGNDGGATILNSWSFTLTGTKPIEGISASIVQEEMVTVKPEAVQVFENESTGTQTITYYSADKLSTSQIKTNVTGTTEKTDTNKTWFYLKIPRNGLTSVTAASITAQLRYNNGGTTFYIRELADTVWESATSGLTENKKTLTTANNDTLLSVPDTGAELYSLKKSSATNIAEYSMESEELTEYINSDADGNVYFAVYAIIGDAAKDGGATILTSWSFALTGTKPVEGTSISGNDITYSVTVEAGENVRLVVGVYGAGDTFLGAEMSPATVSNGETAIELPVSLSEYNDATYIKAYMWESGTLVPYFAPIVKEVA